MFKSSSRVLVGFSWFKVCVFSTLLNTAKVLAKKLNYEFIIEPFYICVYTCVYTCVCVWGGARVHTWVCVIFTHRTQSLGEGK